MIVLVPTDTGETVPVPEPIVAIPVLLLLQVPPPPSLNVVVDPRHTVVVPLMADGSAFTVTTVVAVHPVLIL